jgi:ribonucleotide monophosphatase NagD (HAD superfamily)
MGLELDQMMLVGDNLETDIQCGICAGIDTVLLLSGVTSRKQVEAARPEARPTWVAEHLGDPVWNEILDAEIT